MVRKYIRKTDRQSWDEDYMKEACSAIKNGLGIRKASKTFHVPQTTLHRRIKDLNKRVKGSSKALGYFQVIRRVSRLHYRHPKFTKFRFHQKRNADIHIYPPGAISACHKSGWMQLSIFTMWFEHFIRMSGASKDNPVLLILDGHSTHIKNIEVIDLARENGVELLCLPPHCSHKMQPLDVSFMKPLSTFYDQELEKWLKNNPGRVVTTFQVAEIFGKAYLRAATALTAANGFRRTGIFPTNRDVFEPHEFAAAEPTDLPEPERIAPTNPTNERATMAPQLSSQANPAVSTVTTKPTRSSARKKSVPVTAPTAGLTRSVSLAPRSSVTAPTTGPTPSTSSVPKNSVPATTPTTGSTTPASSAPRISVPVTAPTTAGPTPSMSSVPKNSVPATVPTTGPTTSASSAPRISVSATGPTAGPTTSVPSVLTTTEIQTTHSSVPIPTVSKEVSPSTSTTAEIGDNPTSVTANRPTFVGPSTAPSSVAIGTQPGSSTSCDEAISTAQTASTHDLGYISPFRFSPPPKASVRPNRKPNVRRGKDAVLSSSPYKAELLEAKNAKSRENETRGKAGNKETPTNGASIGRGKRPANASARKIWPKKRSGSKAVTEYLLQDNANDAECIYCSELWSKSMDDGMVQCTNCLEWAHPQCAGIDDDDIEFICDFCA